MGKESHFSVCDGNLPENVQYCTKNQSLTFAYELTVSELVTQNLLRVASCVKAALRESVYKAAALVYVGHHVTSRNTLWAEYIDFSQQSKDGRFFVFKQISKGLREEG